MKVATIVGQDQETEWKLYDRLTVLSRKSHVKCEYNRCIRSCVDEIQATDWVMF